jgi:hypothetical protein
MAVTSDGKGFEYVNPATVGPGLPPLLPAFGTPKNVNTIGIIANNNGGSAVIHDGLNDFEAGQTIDALLPELSNQAKALEIYLGAINNPTGAITTLKNAEATMHMTGHPSITTFLSNMDTQRGNIIDTLFGSDKTAFDAYKAGQYLISRDWQTEPGAMTEAVNDFISKRTTAGVTNASNTANFNIRGTNIPIGNSALVNAQLAELKNTMIGQITSNLGISGTEANKLAEALIIQLGQDQEELRAFRTDLEKEGLTGALEYPCGPTLISAPAEQQSSVRLASVNADFPYDAVKESSDHKLYTGNLIPYSKNNGEEIG